MKKILLGVLFSLSAQAQTIIEANNQFSFDLYKTLSAQSKDNMVVSPASVFTALSMTSVGAKEKTLVEMQKTLHTTGLPHGEFAPWLKSLNSLKHSKLSFVNRLWGKQGAEYYKEFTGALQSNYQSDIKSLDYVKKPEESRLEINTWIADQTQQKIKDLLSQGTITPQTELVITNAVYFLGTWQSPFEKGATSQEPFKGIQKTMSVATMRQTHSFEYANLSDFEYLEMPYKGSELSFAVLLPNEKVKFADFEKKLTLKKLQEALNKKKNEQVALALPKFKSDYAVTLNKPLISMGMKSAFDSDLANFHGVRLIGKGDNLFISTVAHKAFIDVNEHGTEAAAATAVMLMGKSMPSNLVFFKVNRPFVYLIRHPQSGAILFMGRIIQP